jgi:hypothetical protein
MAHTDAPGGSAPGPIRHETTDADLGSAERIMIVTAVLLVIVFALVWGMYVYWRGRAERTDVRPLPVAQRQGDRLPPLPRLQTTPYADLERFRAAEQAALDGYHWVDKANGIAQIPVARAIEIVAEKGLPHWTAAPAPEAPRQDVARRK